MRGRPVTVMTINRKDPLPSGANATPSNPILKRRLLCYPVPRNDDQHLPIAEYRNLLQTHHRYRDQLQAQQMIDEIAEFERKNFGKTKRASPIELNPPDSMQRQTMTEFGLSPGQSPRSASLRVRTATVAANQRYVAKPAMWTVLDDPLIPARPPTKPPTVNTTAMPFQRSQKLSNWYGIPVVKEEIQRVNRKRMNLYNNSLRYLETCENQVREERIRTLVESERAERVARRERTTVTCADLGQQWALKAIGKLPQRDSEDDRNVISPEDQEALNALRRRDEDIMDRHREAKKLREKENGPLLG